jgi:hypothetical protein
MADKTWIATDVALGKLMIMRRDDEIQIERRYQFVDGAGEVLEQIAGGRVVREIPIASLPAEVLSALQTIDNWTHQQALEQEGMAD